MILNDLLSLHKNTQSGVETLIREYTVQTGNSISANDFCEFIEGKIRKFKYEETIEKMGYSGNTQGTSLCACKLSETQVVIIGNFNSPLTMAYMLSISGSTITLLGSYTQINTSIEYSAKLLKLDSTHVLYIYVNSSAVLTCTVLSCNSGVISTTVISQGMNSVYANGDPISVAVINSSSFLVVYRNVNGYVTARKISIASTFTVASTLIVYSSSTSFTKYTIQILNNGTQALIAYSDTNTMRYCALDIADSIIKGTDNSIGGASISSLTSVKITDTLIAILHVQSSTSLYVRLVSILGSGSGSSFNYGTAGGINVPDMSGQTLKADLINDCIIYLCSSSDTKYLIAGLVKIPGTLDAPFFYSQFAKIQYTYDMPSVSDNFVNICNLDNFHIMYVYSGRDTSTSNAYPRSGIIFNINKNIMLNKEKNPKLLALSAGSAGQTKKFMLKGVTKAWSGLITGKTYYCSDLGVLSDEDVHSDRNLVGLALSPTELLLQLN